MKNVNSRLKPKNIPALLLSVGLAFVFLYAAIASTLQPLEWSGFLPGFVLQVVDAGFALHAMAATEVALALWLLSGKYRKYAAALACAMLAGIIVSSPNQLIVTFRDVGLLFAAAALFFIGD